MGVKSRRSITLVIKGINQSCKGFQFDYVDPSHHCEKNVDLSNAKRIYDYNNYYVFPDGRIYNSINKKFLKPAKNYSKYRYVTLCKNRVEDYIKIHLIVADHFLKKKRTGNLQVNHKNLDPTDNRVENLEIITPSENVKHAHRMYKKIKNNFKI